MILVLDGGSLTTEKGGNCEGSRSDPKTVGLFVQAVFYQVPSLGADPAGGGGGEDVLGIPWDSLPWAVLDSLPAPTSRRGPHYTPGGPRYEAPQPHQDSQAPMPSHHADWANGGLGTH